jgi:hypothetical protein
MSPCRRKLPTSRVSGVFIGNGFGDQPSDPERPRRDGSFRAE